MLDSYGLYINQLQGEYRKVFQTICTYVEAKRIDQDALRERMEELLDVFLSAQEAGRPVTKIVGDDTERFCKNFCESFGWKNRLLSYLDDLCSLTWVVFIWSIAAIVFEWTEPGDGGNIDWLHLTADYNIGGVLLGLVLVFFLSGIVNETVQRVMFSLKKFSMNIITGIEIALFLLSVIGLILLATTDSSVIYNPPIWICILICAGYLILYQIGNRKRIQERKKHKISFFSMVASESEKTFPEEMQKTFTKQNQKRVKQGKAPLSWEEFIEDRRANCQKLRKWKWFYFVCPLIIAILCTVVFFINENPSSEVVVFAITVLAAEYAVFLLFWTVETSAIKTTEKWIAKQTEH
jgi:DNA-binding ferritin-like protein (Dps family)